MTHPGMTDKLIIHSDTLDDFGEVDSSLERVVRGKVQPTTNVIQGPDGSNKFVSFIISLPPNTDIDTTKRIEYKEKIYPVLGVEEMNAMGTVFGIKVMV